MRMRGFWMVPALALALTSPAAAGKGKSKDKRTGSAGVLRQGDDDRGPVGTVRRGRDRDRDRDRDDVIYERRRGDRDDVIYDNDGRIYGAKAGKAGRMRFRGMDRNGDGVITRGEWRGNDRSFDVHDRNNDGVVERWEWPNSSSSFHRFDRDDDGVVELWEYRIG